MALVQGEIDLCNLAYDRVGSLTFTLANQASDPLGLRANRVYEQKRKSLLRSFDWPFAREQATLSQLYTLDLDAAPTSAWAVDDTITGSSSGVTSRVIEVISTTSFITTTPVDSDGDADDYWDDLQILTLDVAPGGAGWSAGETVTGATSGVTCEIISVTSTKIYVVSNPSGTFTDGEILSNGTEAANQGVGFPTVGVNTAGEELTNGTGTRTGVYGYPLVAVYVPQTQFTTAFALPSDFLALLINYNGSPGDYPSHRGRVEGRKFLFDGDTECIISYIKDFSDTTLFDSLFVEVLILQLALALFVNTAGTGKIGLKQEAKDDLKLAMKKVRAFIYSENNVSGRSNWNFARYGLSNFPTRQG